MDRNDKSHKKNENDPQAGAGIVALSYYNKPAYLGSELLSGIGVSHYCGFIVWPAY